MSSQHLQPSDEQVHRVSEQISKVRNRIARAAESAKRTSPPRLVAISKLHPPTSILAAHEHLSPAQVHFGENYAQELEAKARVLPRSIRWHFVGKLQSNKAKLVASIPNLFRIETLDSIKLANAVQKVRQSLAGLPSVGVYIQINTSGEQAKGGMDPLQGDLTFDQESEVTKLAIHIVKECPQLQFQGLMTIGSASNSKANKEHAATNISSEQQASQITARALELNRDFAILDSTRNALVKALRAHHSWSEDARRRYQELLTEENNHNEGGLELSMGMSNDLEIAVLAGSNNVRVGTDCFGIRPASREEAMEAMQSELEQKATS